MKILPRIVSLEGDDNTSIFESVAKARNDRVSNPSDQVSGLSSVKEDRPLDSQGNKQGQFKLEPNSVYFIKFVLTREGFIDVKYYWHNEAGASWEHNARDSMPTDPDLPRALKHGHVIGKVRQFRSGDTSLHLQELTASGAKFNWKWLSWVVILFENDHWEFHDTDDPVIFETSKSKNFSCYHGEMIPPSETDNKRKAFAFINFMSADKNGKKLKNESDDISYKFNLIMSVKLSDNASLKVLVDPTGTNDGPSGGGSVP